MFGYRYILILSPIPNLTPLLDFYLLMQNNKLNLDYYTTSWQRSLSICSPLLQSFVWKLRPYYWVLLTGENSIHSWMGTGASIKTSDGYRRSLSIHLVEFIYINHFSYFSIIARKCQIWLAGQIKCMTLFFTKELHHHETSAQWIALHQIYNFCTFWYILIL